MGWRGGSDRIAAAAAAGACRWIGGVAAVDAACEGLTTRATGGAGVGGGTRDRPVGDGLAEQI